MFRLVRAFLREEAAVTAMEYGMIAALITVTILGVLGTLGKDLNQTFGLIQSGLATPTNS